MRKYVSPHKQCIRNFRNKSKIKKYFIYDKIQKIWKEHVDEVIQSNTQILHLNNDVVTIKTSAPTWKTELGFQKSKLILIINKHLDSKQKIKDIKFI